MHRLAVYLRIGLVVACSVSATSRADLILGLQYTDMTTSKTVMSGTSVFVELTLTDTDASTPLAAEGLVSGGGRLIQTTGDITLTPGLITGNAGWIESFDTNPASDGGMNEVAKAFGATDFFAGPAVFPVGDSLVIATFELVATGMSGDVDTLTADLLGVGIFSNTTFDTLEELDLTPPTFGSVNLTIGAASVPEPASSAFLLATFAAVALRRRLRRHPEA